MSDNNRPTHGFNVSQQDTARQAMFASSAKMPSTKSQSPSGSKQNQTLKIVETGQEHTGRWTREEHNAFLMALQQYGKEWKKVAAKVKTRTVVQTRTHAQKYFQKLQKGLANEKGDVEMGTVAEAKKILPIASARRSGQSSYGKKGRKKDRSLLATAMSTQRKQAAAATQAAAQLMTQMSKVNTLNEEQSMLSPPPGHNPQMGGVFSSQSMQNHFSQGTPGAASVFSMGTNFATPMAGNMHFHGQPQHQMHPQMKIVAPQPEQTIKKNMFPEPSPAACGKRKAIELAAAQMLAGVAASGGNGTMTSGEMTRRPTPPPEMRHNDINTIQLNNDFTAAAGMANSKFGGSLQIINPENFEQNEVKKRNLGNEPVTPWDGQLEALSR